jgi:hypothetical protein
MILVQFVCRHVKPLVVFAAVEVNDRGMFGEPGLRRKALHGLARTMLRAVYADELHVAFTGWKPVQMLDYENSIRMC